MSTAQWLHDEVQTGKGFVTYPDLFDKDHKLSLVDCKRALLDFAFEKAELVKIWEVGYETDRGYASELMDSGNLQKLIDGGVTPSVCLFMVANPELQGYEEFLMGKRELLQLSGVRPGINFTNASGEERVATQKKTRLEIETSTQKRNNQKAFRAEPTRKTAQK
jgi:hypothetical protein